MQRYPFPTVFSTCSKKDLVASLEKGVGMCLYNMPEVKLLYGGQKCGNGYIEEGEECDCGEPESHVNRLTKESELEKVAKVVEKWSLVKELVASWFSDRTWQQGSVKECLNPCCNATTCTLKGDAVCAHGQCCENCQLKPAGTLCRESSNSCDLPEFCTGVNPHCPANVYLHDGHACHSMDGYCYNGICQTHEQQCITLWGTGAKPAPGICFERVNSAGDPYGNCGKDPKGSFAKCEARDARCGKIQCQGGANRPVIGTNAVSIETNIPLHEGGRILCRGTHVYLGDDMPDPGLVLAGTKCAEGKECNNKKNCHCEAQWAPPFCDRAGFGGSIDSGPMRQAGKVISSYCLNRSDTEERIDFLLEAEALCSHVIAVDFEEACKTLRDADRFFLSDLQVCVLMCVLSYVTTAGVSAVAVGALLTLLCLLSVGVVVCVKRKALVQMLCLHKKSTIQKIRREASTPQTQSVFRVSPQHKPLVHLQPDTDFRHVPDCPIRCQPVHISHPLPITESIRTGPGASAPHHRTLVSHTLPACRAIGFHTLPRQLSYSHSQDHEKPCAPQKPLPADPLIRAHRVGRSVSSVGARTPASLAIQIPTVPRPPPSIPFPNRPLPRLPQAFSNH
ncbi:hypothetical protein DNTS_031870 [Danionella cerebrum]|uniref:Disintegrin domain-containing protein n=1 Tax=Danionella cerebrum TaxID=2873325 RepID=A0A553RGQ8_9TELE|nr:hypothetical protein DNTS_031870 [Danionella translucida]